MRRVLPFVVLALTACAGRPPPVAPPPLDDPEDEEERANIAGIVLPRLPLDVAIDDPELEPGWQRTIQALSMPTPRPPAGEAWEVEEWVDEELTGWMRRRAESIAAAQRALEPARMGRPEVSVVASALLGLAYSRFALDLRGIPTPEVFASDAERSEAFQAALRSATQPLWRRALDAFGSCSSVAAGAPAYTLDRWRQYCDAEIESVSAMLPAPAREEPGREEDRPRERARDR
jgi:hypothetical protein